MSCRKRRASSLQEHEPPTIRRRVIHHPVIAAEAMVTDGEPKALQEIVKEVYRYVRSYFAPWTGSATEHEIAHEIPTIPNEQTIIHTPKQTRSSSMTRSRMRNPVDQDKKRRARSAGTAVHHGVSLQEVDLDGVDATRAREIIDAQWDPPPFSFAVKKPKSTTDLLISAPKSLSNEGQDEEAGLEQTSRGHLDDSTDAPVTPVSSISLSRNASINKNLHLAHDYSRSLRTPESQTSYKLEDKLKSLLVDDSESDLPSLRIANSKQVEREKIRKECERKAQKEKDEARKLRRLKRQFPLRSFIDSLTPEQERVFDKIKTCDFKTDVIIQSRNGTDLRQKDFDTLIKPRAWLNDEIINAYLDWVASGANTAAADEAKKNGEQLSSVPKFINAGSYFLSTLEKNPERAFRTLGRLKAPGISLLEVDSVYIPICQGLHWTLGVVRPVAKTIEYFDSMGGGNNMRQHLSKIVRKWLKSQLGSMYQDAEWTVPISSCAYQSNGYDCGVFVCTNALCVAYGLDLACYTQEDMTKQRKLVAAVILNQGYHGDLAWNTEGLFD